MSDDCREPVCRDRTRRGCNPAGQIVYCPKCGFKEIA